jgi:hypothetical protein
MFVKIKIVIFILSFVFFRLVLIHEFDRVEIEKKKNTLIKFFTTKQMTIFHLEK